MIGWWGHCHNEAPGNAMGIDPQKGVEMYRADRGVAADKASAEPAPAGVTEKAASAPRGGARSKKPSNPDLERIMEKLDAELLD